MELGYHLNFRDPDNIALEINAPNDVLIAWLAEFKQREIPQQEIDSRLNEYLASLASDAGPD
jgi:hypothetical protein